MSSDLTEVRATQPDRIPTDPRLSRRRRLATRLRKRRALARGAALLAVCAAVYLALWSPLLRVVDVKVMGGRHTTAADVAVAAGISESDNLLLLSTAEVASTTEKLPWVRRASVERKLPGTVLVTVSERRPAMTLEAEGRSWALDRRGRVLAAGRPRPGLPVVVATGTSPVVGGVLPPGVGRGAVGVLRSLGPRLRGAVDTVLAPGPQRISLRLADDTLVRWGSASRSAAKGAVLRALLRHLRRGDAGAAYVDVSVPENPAVSDLAPRSAIDRPRVSRGRDPMR